MEKIEMFKNYEKFNASEKYIIGFSYKGMVYMQMVDRLDLDMITLEHASKNQGVSLRFRPKTAHKVQMITESICLGTMEMLIDQKYNKGEMFEKVITEYYGQKWTKDTIPFHKQGDININGIEIQIKFEKAGLCTSRTLERLGVVVA